MCRALRLRPECVNAYIWRGVAGWVVRADGVLGGGKVGGTIGEERALSAEWLGREPGNYGFFYCI
jgi:hypothetical protein